MLLATQFEEYYAKLKGPNESEIEWDTLDNGSKLRLFWNAPKKFFGNIVYSITDENNAGTSIAGIITKLPVVLELPARRGQLFSNTPAKYNFAIHTYMIFPAQLSRDNKEHHVECSEKSEIEIGK